MIRRPDAQATPAVEAFDGSQLFPAAHTRETCWISRLFMMESFVVRLLAVIVSTLFPITYNAVAIAEKPVKVDYSKIAFYPERWKEAEVEFDMLAWNGKHITFLTRPGQYDEKQMSDFVRMLDEGWQSQHELVGKALDSEIRFLDAFTNLSADEKGNRLSDQNGRLISPSDQPVMYATAMLKLRKDYGGDEWVKNFLHSLRECEEFRATDEGTAIPQFLNWLVCASVASGKDLSPVFADRWRMPLTGMQRDMMKRTDWSNPELSVAKKVNDLLTQ